MEANNVLKALQYMIWCSVQIVEFDNSYIYLGIMNV
jgi:hypothetical protein